MSHHTPHGSDHSEVELPQNTASPLVLSVGIGLAALGIATSPVFLVVGIVVFIAGLTRWIEQLLPGRGHRFLPYVAPDLRSQQVIPVTRPVAQLEEGVPGYRFRLPVRVRPISAGIKGGIVGGLVMPLPALALGLYSGHGIWWPVNLLAGMALPGVESMSTAQLEQFQPTLFLFGVITHLVVSLISGLMYGVLMPMLPEIPKPLAWGALLMPLLWTGASFLSLSQMNPAIRSGIAWPWFMLSQFIFGVVAALVFMSFQKKQSIVAGLCGGLVGGLLMPIPAILWSLATGHGIWYPVNLLSAMAVQHGANPTIRELEAFHSDWFVAALAVHVVFSLTFGLAFALVLPRLPKISAPIAWGGLLLPLVWTAWSYSLMGVVNPVLEDRVEWPWFVVSQFVFGIVAAIVVNRSEQIAVPPAGEGPDPGLKFSAH